METEIRNLYGTIEELKKESEDNDTVYEYQNFMSRSTFLDWMRGRRDSTMKKKDEILILKLHKLSLVGDG